MLGRSGLVIFVFSRSEIGKDQGQVAKAINRLIELGLIVKKGVQLSAQ
jgi:predicted transcriptional regulator